MDEFADINTIIDKIHNLMVYLRGLKIRGWLRQYTLLQHTLDNVTRWNSNFKMVNKNLRISPIFYDSGRCKLVDKP